MGCTCSVETKESFSPNITKEYQEESIKIENLEEFEELTDAKKKEELEIINDAKEKEEPEIINDIKKEEELEIIINNIKKEEEQEIIINDIKKEEKPEIINEVKEKEEPEIINEVKKKDEPKIINEIKKKEEIPFNKKNCNSLVSSLPVRTKTSLPSLKNMMKSKTKNFSEKEKSYVIFKWECQNIDYDVESYFSGGNADCTPEGVFRKGKTVCSGYSRLFEDIASHLGLNVLCVNAYAKGFGYHPGQKIKETNHEYNVVNIDGNWYAIDCTWGAGHIEGKHYVREFNEFYYLANPELIIKTHFPEEEKWQLTEKRYTLDDFLKWPEVESDFYIFGFTKFSPEEGVLTLKDVNNQKFIVWGGNIKNKGVLCNVSFLLGKTYFNQPGLSFIIPCENRFEINCIFNKKGTYLINIFGNKDGGDHYRSMIEYKANVKNDSKKELKFPHTYTGANAIKLIEPLYNGLKSGKKVKFKMESDLDTIIIKDSIWHYLKRNEEGFFEKEIKIKTKPRKNLVIGKPEGKSIIYLIEYDVIS